MELIQEKTDKALSALYTTTEKLKEANDDISVERQSNTKKICDLEFQNCYLDTTKRRNEKIINNFERLLGFDLDNDGDIDDEPTENESNEAESDNSNE